MRKFIVLGFATTSKSELGEVLHHGSDRGEAIGITNGPDPQFARKEMYELAFAHKCRHFNLKVESSEEATAPSLSESAQKLVAEHQLTDEDLSLIQGTGSSGNIVKTDVESYLKAKKAEAEVDEIEDSEADQVEPEGEDDPEDEDEA